MITDLILFIFTGFMAICKGLLFTMSLGIPDVVETYITNALSTIGTKFNAVYHMIPAANHLFIIVGLMLTISTTLLILRITIFFFNKARGSGGNI